MNWVAWTIVGIFGGLFIAFLALCVVHPWDNHTLSWPPAPRHPPDYYRRRHSAGPPDQGNGGTK
jgi:hypothetical protein